MGHQLYFIKQKIKVCAFVANTKQKKNEISPLCHLEESMFRQLIPYYQRVFVRAKNARTIYQTAREVAT